MTKGEFMRYQENDNLHLDFYGLTNTTIKYVSDKFSVEELDQLLFDVGKNVYKSINQKLAKGDTSELLQHWIHFLEREKGVFSIRESGNEITLTVSECPAIRHLKQLGIEISPHFCDQTIYINNGMCDDTAFKIETKITGEGSCVQTLKKCEIQAKSY